MTDLASIIAKRVASAAGIVVGLVVILFVLQQTSTVSPVHAMLGPGASAAAVAAESRKLGLDRPLWVQFVTYLGHLAEGNFGISYRTRGPVGPLLMSAFPATLELALFALLLAISLALVLGFTSALAVRGSSLVRILMLLAGSTPSFLIAIAGLVVLYKDLGWVPVGGQASAAYEGGAGGGMLAVDGLLSGHFALFANVVWHLLLPGLCVALGPAVSIGRMLRSSLAAGLGSDWARTARSKGLRERAVVVRHALRNSLGPTLTMAGLQLAVMLGGVVVVEDIFSWPGVGFLMAQSISSSDLPVITGVTLILGVTYVVINLLVDIVQVVIDPRQRL